MYEFAEDLHVEEAVVQFYGFRLQTRMAVVLLSGRRLLLYSPVWPEPELRAELDRLGDVAYILSPNKIHNQTLRAFGEAYPRAELHAPPGLAERCPDLDITATLGDELAPPWAGELEVTLTAGNDFFTEAVLFHRRSRSLLVGDLVENLQESAASRLGRAAARLFGVGREPIASPEFRFYTHDAEAAATSFEGIAAWDFERIFLCHGDLIEERPQEALRMATDSILRAARGRPRTARWVLDRLARLQ